VLKFKHNILRILCNFLPIIDEGFEDLVIPKCLYVEIPVENLDKCAARKDGVTVSTGKTLDSVVMTTRAKK
jgi:hypothetical protein